MTAEDVVFSLRRALSPKSECAQECSLSGSSMRKVTASCGSGRTESDPAGTAVSIGIIIKAWAERYGAVEAAPYTDAKLTYVEDHANGTGPFVLEAYEPGVRTVLVKNPAWLGAGSAQHRRVGRHRKLGVGKCRCTSIAINTLQIRRG